MEEVSQYITCVFIKNTPDEKAKNFVIFFIQHFARLFIYLSEIENSKFVEFLVFELSGKNVFLHYNRRHQISHLACQQLANTYGDVIM